MHRNWQKYCLEIVVRNKIKSILKLNRTLHFVWQNCDKFGAEIVTSLIVTNRHQNSKNGCENRIDLCCLGTGLQPSTCDVIVWKKSTQVELGGGYPFEEWSQHNHNSKTHKMVSIMHPSNDNLSKYSYKWFRVQNIKPIKQWYKHRHRST